MACGGVWRSGTSSHGKRACRISEKVDCSTFFISLSNFCVLYLNDVLEIWDRHLTNVVVNRCVRSIGYIQICFQIIENIKGRFTPRGQANSP